MTLRYAVTLEFQNQPPLTSRGVLEVANPRLGARRAVEATFRDYPNRQWASLSILLEREPDQDEDELDEPENLDDQEKAPPARLTRQERLQRMADAGIDTWEEYRCER